MNLQDQLDRLPNSAGIYRVEILKLKAGKWKHHCYYDPHNGFYEPIMLDSESGGASIADRLTSSEVEMIESLDKAGKIKVILKPKYISIGEGTIEFGSVSWWGPDIETQTECNRELVSETTRTLCL